jgi:hypothetical protein
VPKPVLCHHCRRRKVSPHGGDATCSPACRRGLAKSRQEAEGKLTQLGFTQVARVLNLWEKGGVHISLDQVIREGIDPTIARHSAARANIHG